MGKKINIQSVTKTNIQSVTKTNIQSVTINKHTECYKNNIQSVAKTNIQSVTKINIQSVTKTKTKYFGEKQNFSTFFPVQPPIKNRLLTYWEKIMRQKSCLFLKKIGF